MATIALRATLSILDVTRDDISPINQALSVVQIVAIGMSLLTNVSSSAIVGLYVWYVAILNCIVTTCCHSQSVLFYVGNIVDISARI